METAREVAEKVIQLCIDSQGSWRLDRIEKHIVQFAEAQVEEALEQTRPMPCDIHKGTRIVKCLECGEIDLREAYRKGFSECREKAAKEVARMLQEYREEEIDPSIFEIAANIHALTPDGKEDK